MPTIWYEQGIRFSFYSSDRAEPPHIHAFTSGGHAKWWLRPPVEAYAQRLKRSERGTIRRIVLERQAEFFAAWEEHFGRNG